MNAIELRQQIPASVLVVDRAGASMGRVGRQRAYELVSGGAALFRRRTDGRVECVQLIPRDERVYQAAPGSRGRHYSHDRETGTNPRGCWTLVHIPKRDRDLYVRVETECLAVAA